MHKRIRELAEQAHEFAVSTYQKRLETEEESDVFFYKIKDTKFAELIIRECAGIVDNYGRWILYDKLAVKIKKHFGVEE